MLPVARSTAKLAGVGMLKLAPQTAIIRPKPKPAAKALRERKAMGFRCVFILEVATKRRSERSIRQWSLAEACVAIGA